MIYPQWTIGQLARQAGCTVETVRHYERIGLLDRPARSEGGYRLYGPEDVRRLTFVRRSRELGFSQAQIKQLLAVATRPEAECREIGPMIRAHLEEVRMHLRQLQRLELTLASAAAECEEAPQTPSCRFLETLCGAEFQDACMSDDSGDLPLRAA